jgi:hypothetical protein
MVMALDTDQTPEFDVILKQTLASVETEVGLILCNGQGVHDPFAIAQDQQGRSAIKIATGDSKHSDREPPYATDEVRDWSVGRGMDDGDLEEGRFYDSKAAWTQSKNKILMGPAWRFGEGLGAYSHINMFQDEGDATAYANENTYNHMALNSQATRHLVAVKQYIAAGTVLSAGNYEVDLILRSFGTPPGAQVRIYTVDGNYKPDVLRGSTTFSSISTDGEWKLIRTRVVTNNNLAHGQYIAIAFELDSSGDSDNYYEILGGDYTINDYNWFWNGSSYLATTTGGMYFRMAGNKPGDFKSHLVMYGKVPYAILDFDDDINQPEVFRNGFFGRISMAWNSQDATPVGKFKDLFTTHTADEWNGWQLLIFDGKGSGEITSHYTIVDHTTDEFTLDKAWDNLPNSGSHYAIVGGNRWDQVSTGTIFKNTDRITDVKTILGAVYIMRGDYTPAVRMIYPTLDDWYGSNVGFFEMPEVKGTFIEYAQDSNANSRIWVATRDYVEKSATPPPKYNYAGQSDTGDLDLQQGDIVTNGDMELDANWDAVGTVDTNERTTEFVKEQTYARKVVVDGADEGITQTVNTTSGDYYKIEASVHLPNAAYIVNGDMELDANWDDSGSPTTNERSIEQVHGGTYSRKIVADADEEGIEQSLPFIGLTENTYFEFIAWIYIDGASANGMKITLDSTDIVAFSSTGAWTRIHGSFLVTSSSHTLKFLSDGGAATFFVDDVISGSANGAKVMFGGSEIASIPAQSTIDATGLVPPASYVDISGYFKATASTHTFQVLSDGGAAMFFVDALRAIEAPTSLRSARSEKITNIIPYGDNERLWVLTDGSLQEEGSGNLQRVPIDEMRNAADWRNGVSAVTYDVYLFFTFLNGGLERFYKSNLDDVGPDRDEGLPINQYVTNRRGDIADMSAYPTGIFLAIDAGDQNTYAQSSILFWNNTGYHEIWRGDDYQTRIRSVMVQPVQGDRADKLWFQYGQDLLFCFIDKNPLTNENMRYTYRYKVDNDDSWTSIGTFTASPTDELDIGSHDVVGNRFKYQIIIHTDNNQESPVIEAITLDLIENIPVKDSWTYQFLLKDAAISKNGTEQHNRIEDVVTQLNTWKNTPQPVYQEAVHSAYNGKWGPILSFTTRPIKVDPQGQEEEMVGTITIIEA